MGCSYTSQNKKETNKNLFNKDGGEISVLQMEVDDPNFSLGDVTDFNTYHDLKPPEKLKGERTEASGNRLKSPNFSESDASTLKTCRKYKKRKWIISTF